MNPGRAFRVLIGIEQTSPEGWDSIREIDILRGHLHHDLEDVCDVQLLVLNTNTRLISQFQVGDTHVIPVEPAFADEGIGPEIGDLSLRQAIATAREQDCDYIIVPDKSLPYIDVVYRQFHVQLGDISFLHRFIEIFIRGFGVAWSFGSSVLNGNFNHLYFSELQETLAEGFLLMDRLAGTEHPSSTADTMRSLLYNRLPQVCYSRDQLLFYLLQREAEMRRGTNGRPFEFELNYHLNFYYILTYGALDHAALVVNEVCQLGLCERKVGAAYRDFLGKLEAPFPAMHRIFSAPETAKIVTLLGQLRNLTAHRGSVTPAKLLQRPDREPTNDELDAYLSETGPNSPLSNFADRSETEQRLLELERSFARLDILERNPLDNDIVPAEINGKSGYVRPFEDVTWPFRTTLNVLRQIIQECLKISIRRSEATT